MGAFLTVEKKISRPQVIVVMAGEPAIRLPAAAKQFHQGGISQILLTNDGVVGRWSREKQRNLYQVEWAAHKLVALGVPESAIVTLPYSNSGTIHDVKAVQRYVKDHCIERLLVVTSDYHTRRTLWTFQQVFKNSSVEFGIYGAKSLSPVESGLWVTLTGYRTLIAEVGKYLFYRFCH